MKNKRKTMRYLAIILIIINISSLFGQPTFKDPVYDRPIPPSPISAAFRQFAGYTPSLSTGAVNVPISLYEVKAGGFTLPISLQYYTSGIKLSDTAYPVGYGWLLNPGLRITRTIMGRPDGLSYAMKINDRETVNQWSQQEIFDYCRRALYDPATDRNPNVGTLHDTEYDIFTLHLPLGNYPFIIKDNKIVTSGNRLKIKLLYWGQKIAGFEVKDESGVIYYFGKLENESNYQNCAEFNKILYSDDPTAWMLRKIKLPGVSNEINLTWTTKLSMPGLNNAYTSCATILDYKDVVSHCSGVDTNPSGSQTVNDGNEGSIALMLEKIDFPLGSVSFKYKGYSTPYLTNMTVSNKNNEPIKLIDFSYEENGYMLLLNSVKMTGEGIYKFTYNPIRFDLINRQDYWGYYNGKPNASLIPKMKLAIYRNNYDGDSNYVEEGLADRSIDKDKMQANMLTRVDYPTGGFTAFEYEPHRFEGQETNWINGLPYFDPTNMVSLKEGGGLRVTKVTTQADATSTPTIKTYKYGKNENGLGNITYAPTLDTFVDEYMTEFFETLPPCGPGEAPITIVRYCRMLNINAQSKNSQLFITSPPVFYDFVTEYTNNTNKTEYSFSPTNIDEIGHLRVFKRMRPFVRQYNNLFNKGSQLINKTDYIFKNNKYEPIESTSYNYTLNQYDPIMGIYIGRSGINIENGGPDFGSLKGLSDELLVSPRIEALWYIYMNTYIDVSYSELTSEERTLYTEQGALKQRVNYKYNVNSNLLISKEKISTDNIKATESYLYPFDYLSTEALSQKSILSAMNEQNILSSPFYTSYTVNGATIEKYTEFKDWGNNLFLPEKVYLETKGNPKELRLTRYNYDSFGNPVYLVKDDVTQVVYLWSYGGQYPIAEIKNATYDQVKTALGVAPESLSTNLEPNMELVNTLRTKLPQSLVSTYTYKPLVGMLTATDPAGLTTHYEYDTFGRLANTYIDNETSGKDLVQTNQYNYWNSGATNDDNNTDPDTDEAESEPFTKGVESSVLMWQNSSAYDHIGTRAYDYDNNVALGYNDGSYKTYKTRQIGEYEWTTENLFIEYMNRMGTALAWANPTQDIINQMNQEFQQKDNITLAEFNKVNGSYVSLYPTASSYRNSFKFYTQKNGTELSGWDLPNSADFFQLFGQAPVVSTNTFENIMNFLGANKADVPATYTADWFEYKNTSGFTMTPLGRRHSGEAGENGQKWFGYKVECGLRLKDYPTGMILFNRSQGISISGNLYHFCQARYCKPKTDQELGYKMYIDNCNDAVVMYPISRVTKLTELPKGLERGIALRYSNKSQMKVYKKWSEIQAEAAGIRQAIPTIPPMQTLPVSPCEEPEVITPDPYTKGKESSVLMWQNSSAYDHIGTRAYDYDNNVALGYNDGSYKTYKTREIGEYEWTSENLFIEYMNRMGTALAWANPTQDIINQMNQGFQQKDNVTLAEFNKINGSYVSLYETASSYRNSFKFYTQRNGTELPDWNLPTLADFYQMFGQAPTVSANPIENIMNFLGANKADVPATYTADWFEYKNTSGFTMTPLGRRHSGEAGENGQKWMGYKVESSFRLKDYPTGMIHFHRTDGISINPNLYHFCQARYSRAKTAQELGYKMYIDATNDQIVMLPYDQVSTLPELPKGLERGVALRYTNKAQMKVLKKWSEIQAEANQIKSAIKFN